MYIAWKKKPYGPTKILQAEIRISKRNLTSGKPVSHYVAYLGSIREDRLDDRVLNPQFWEKAIRKIESLNISAREKISLKDQLRERLPLIKCSIPTPLPAFIKRLLARGKKKSALRPVKNR